MTGTDEFLCLASSFVCPLTGHSQALVRILLTNLPNNMFTKIHSITLTENSFSRSGFSSRYDLTCPKSLNWPLRRGTEVIRSDCLVQCLNRVQLGSLMLWIARPAIVHKIYFLVYAFRPTDDGCCLRL